MKKFLCMTMLMLAALTASAGGSVKAASPPEQDIATPAAEDGMTLVAYRWPGCKPECTTTDAITPTTAPPTVPPDLQSGGNEYKDLQSDNGIANADILHDGLT